MTPPPTEPEQPPPSLADALANKNRRIAANRRTTAGFSSRFYPMMLIASTVISAGFCALYITKPVVMTFEAVELRMPEQAHSARASGSQEPVADARAPEAPLHEETNLRVQHVLNASTADGDLSRIVLDVPVIYQSRQLRWTAAEVEQARAFHGRLAKYHDQSRQLRELGQSLLTEWNALIERSVPVEDLRADSPSLPSNQITSNPETPTADLDTKEAIEVQPTDQ